MSIIQSISDSWSWIGLEPNEIVGENDFGNLIIKDTFQRYWRLCPEDVYCEVIAENRGELDELSKNQDFLEDWYMESLVSKAKEKHGELPDNHKYCLVTPGALGGAYDISNIKTAPLTEIIMFSGNVAKKIENLPDGAEINLNVVE
jgi:hypothetical protein